MPRALLIVGAVASVTVSIASPSRPWLESDSGDKKVRKELRAALKSFGLPVTGALFEKTYAYVQENY